MSDVEHIHLLSVLQDAINHAIHVRLAAIQQMPKLRIFMSHWTAVGIPFKAQDGLLQPPIPSQGSLGVFGIDFGIEMSKIAFSEDGDLNEIRNAELRTRRKIPLPS